MFNGTPTQNFPVITVPFGGTRHLCEKNEPTLDRFGGGCMVGLLAHSLDNLFSTEFGNSDSAVIIIIIIIMYLIIK